MFLGERLWNNVDWGKGEGGDTQKRSIAKVVGADSSLPCAPAAGRSWAVSYPSGTLSTAGIALDSQALAWRAFAATNTLFASIVLTKGKAGVAGKIAGTDSVIKTILFYFYERVWVSGTAPCFVSTG